MGQQFIRLHDEFGDAAAELQFSMDNQRGLTGPYSEYFKFAGESD